MKYHIGQSVGVRELGGDNLPIGSGIIIAVNEETKLYKINYTPSDNTSSKVVEVPESRLFTAVDLINQLKN